MNIEKMIGYKLFKELDDGSIDMIRIKKVKKSLNNTQTKVIIINNNGEESTVDMTFLKEYTPLEPDGYLTCNITNINTTDGGVSKDVIVTASKILNIKIGDIMPFAVCRQNITDIFYNLLAKSEDDMIVGLAVNQNSCPSNFDFRILLACNEIEYTQFISFYRTDTLENLFEFINTSKFDTVLEENFMGHAKLSDDPSVMLKKHDKGWCKDLRTLLRENAFQSDIDEMLGISEVEFDMSEHFLTKRLPNDEEYTSMIPELINFFNQSFKININDITVIEFGHDINLGDFNNARYFLIRDNKKKLYLCVYTCNGEYHEADLEAKANESDFSTKFRFNFYSKYNNNK